MLLSTVWLAVAAGFTEAQILNISNTDSGAGVPDGVPHIIGGIGSVPESPFMRATSVRS